MADQDQHKSVQKERVDRPQEGGVIPVLQPAGGQTRKDAPIGLSPASTPVPASTAKDVDEERQDHIKRQLKSNFWLETTALLRWATIGLMATLSGLLFKEITTIGAAGVISTLASPLFMGIAFAAACSGVAMVLSSQYSRRIFLEKTFDTQEFQIRRQADLIGQSVTQAVNTATPTLRADGKAWAEAAPKRQSQSSWQETLASAAPEIPTLVRPH